EGVMVASFCVDSMERRTVPREAGCVVSHVTIGVADAPAHEMPIRRRMPVGNGSGSSMSPRMQPLDTPPKSTMGRELPSARATVSPANSAEAPSIMEIFLRMRLIALLLPHASETPWLRSDLPRAG